MRTNKTIFLLVGLFLITNLLGLTAATQIQQVESIQQTAAQHQSASSGIYFFVLIGISTALMLILYKYHAQRLIKAWFMLALFMTTVLFFGAFVHAYIATVLAVLVIIGHQYSTNLLVKDILTIFPFAGAGAFFGSILGFEAAVVLLLVLSVYDYFSVNISEHMISLAKSGMETDTFMGFTYPKGDADLAGGDLSKLDLDEQPDEAAGEAEQQVGMLGGGDIVIPLVFAATAYGDYGVVPAVASIGGAAAGLYFLLSKGQQGKFYPAIPPVAIGALAGFGIIHAAMMLL